MYADSNKIKPSDSRGTYGRGSSSTVRATERAEEDDDRGLSHRAGPAVGQSDANDDDDGGRTPLGGTTPLTVHRNAPSRLLVTGSPQACDAQSLAYFASAFADPTGAKESRLRIPLIIHARVQAGTTKTPSPFVSSPLMPSSKEDPPGPRIGAD
ncbi:hypothetical protein KM043_000825 [Ampulex compressa]|nr:hypothetical protein KM043_000825 [Ampulex compressa]